MPELPAPAGVCLQASRKRLLKADETKREAFVAEYAALRNVAQRTEVRIFFAEGAHFRADAELWGKWVLKGQPALVDSTSPQHGEKASYYSAVCLETEEVEWMELESKSNAGTSAAFLGHLRKEAPWAAHGDLGQCPGPSRRAGARVPRDAWAGVGVGEPPFSRG